jgi:hypothetical protein
VGLRHVPYIGTKRPRPRLCGVCHEDATFVEVEVHQVVIIDREGKKRYEKHSKGFYYCDEHTGMLV